MLKYIILTLVTLCLFNITAYANPDSARTSAKKHKEEMGLGMGALIGGLIAGPPGAIIGAAGGAWFGNKEKEEDLKISSLEKRLIEKQGELAYLESQFGDLQSQYGQQLQKVSLEKRLTSLEHLSQGVSVTVYFRTNSAEIDEVIVERITKLAHFLKTFPEIQLQLEAHADQRGSEKHNKQLSQQRARTIETALIAAGLPAKQIRTYAYGESRAVAKETDQEGHVFDRRVNIYLTLDTEA